MSDERKGWFDEPKNVDKIFKTLVALCVLLFVVDLFLHRHTHYDLEKLPGFYGFFSFAAFWCIVLICKQLRKVLMRDEDYYE